MDSQYIVIPRLRAQNANMLSTYWLFNGAPVSASVMFAHAMGRHFEFVNEIQGVSLIHHNNEIQAEQGEYGKLATFQRRGASYIDKDDYSKNTLSLSLQPTSTRHLEVSLVIKLSEEAFYVGDDEITEYLKRARFAGGTVLSHGDVFSLGSEEELSRSLPRGYFVIDRSDLVNGEDPLDAILSIHNLESDFYEHSFSKLIEDVSSVAKDKKDEKYLTELVKLKEDTKNKQAAIVKVRRFIGKIEREGRGDSKLLFKVKAWQRKHTWLSATNLGYLLHETPKRREFVRENYAHSFAEPLAGIVQYVSTSGESLQNIDRTFWKHTWLDDETFIINQENRGE